MAPNVQQNMKKGIRFAKRTMASTKLSRRIGWLNKNADLVEEINYSEVKDLLSQVGDQEAMRVLKEVEGKGAEIRDPTAYVKAAALRLLHEEIEGGNKGGGNGGSSGARRRARGRPLAEPEALDADTLFRKVEKRVQWLNANAGLSKELSLEEVGDALVSSGQREAMEVLKNLEDNAAEVRDPNGWVIANLKKSSGGGEQRGRGTGRRRHDNGGAKGKGTTSGPPVRRGVIKTSLKVEASERRFLGQVRRRIDWINANCGLAAELDFGRVGHLLVRLGDRQETMKILKVLEENAAEVRDPNAYVARAAKRAAEHTGGGAHFTEEHFVEDPRPAARGQDAGVDKKIRQRVGWINKRVPLSTPLEYDRVAPFLSEIELSQAMEILKRLEENAAEVRDPGAYVVAAAIRMAEQQQQMSQHPPPYERAPPSYERAPPPYNRAPPPFDRGEVPAEAKLRKRITWLNNHTDLAAPLIFERVAPDLLSVDLLTALEVLNNLEENVKTVREPNAYVVAGVRREAGGGGGGSPGPPTLQRGKPPREQSNGSPSARGPPPREAPAEERLYKRVMWLNKNICPDVQLDFDEVAPPLLQLPQVQAMEVLKKFEEVAPDVRNPTAFVVAAARRITNNGGAGGGGGGGSRQAIGSGPPKPSRAPGSASSRTGSASSAGRTPIGLAGDLPPKGLGRGPTMMALPGGSTTADDKVTYYGSPEEKIRKRIDWMNNNVALTFPIAYERAAPELLKVDLRQAMECLKRLEEDAHEIRDPTGFVISLARRRGRDDEGDRSRRRRRGSSGPQEELT